MSSYITKDNVVIDGSVHILFGIDGTVDLNNRVDGQSGIFFIEHIFDGDTYDGPYEVTPSIRSQTLETRLKFMADDLVVKEIPYYETSNLQGITVYIADSLEDNNG